MPTLRRFVCLALVLACLMTVVPVTRAATAADLPNELFLTQQGNGTCTLCSATMMIRSIMYINDHPYWSSVTEAGLKPIAWYQGVGLKWEFSFAMEDAIVEVGHKGVNGFSTQELAELLEAHPEGIVLYCGDIPHAVFLTDYTDGVFYCAETVKGYSGERIPLEESWICTKYGTQERAIANATAYWYIASYEKYDPDACGCSQEYAGIYVCTTYSSELMIRGGHGTSYAVMGYIPYGAEVYVSAASGDGNSDWAHVSYNGMCGYASMRYLSWLCHEHVYETEVVEPTCEAQGYTLYTCVGCGDSRKEDYVDALGHDFDSEWEGVCLRCGASHFTDVAEDAYYREAVLWAYTNGITTGYSETKFVPNDTCTRDQVVTFLWRAAGQPDSGNAGEEFQDVTPDQFSYEATVWAVEEEITTGLSQYRFGPRESCTRDQVVTFLWRYFGCPEATIENPFTDVREDSYAYQAILWAYENGITTGLTDTVFSPNTVCTRAEIVTFLYRAMENM